MPLLQGSTAGIIRSNIKLLLDRGYSQPQAVAIAMRHAGRRRRKKKAQKPEAE
jgi:hypothetical protein